MMVRNEAVLIGVDERHERRMHTTRQSCRIADRIARSRSYCYVFKITWKLFIYTIYKIYLYNHICHIQLYIISSWFFACPYYSPAGGSCSSSHATQPCDVVDILEVQQLAAMASSILASQPAPPGWSSAGTIYCSYCWHKQQTIIYIYTALNTHIIVAGRGYLRNEACATVDPPPAPSPSIEQQRIRSQYYLRITYIIVAHLLCRCLHAFMAPLYYYLGLEVVQRDVPCAQPRVVAVTHPPQVLNPRHLLQGLLDPSRSLRLQTF